jgi:hypothetical protein
MEIHHIVPKCMGGEDSRSNLVILSPTAHAIISIYQSEFYGRPCFHRRQLKFLPPELWEKGEYWISQNAKVANAARKNTSRSEECRSKQRAAALRPEAQPPHKKAAQSKAITATNSKLKPCSDCGKLMNSGNLTQHIRRQTCKR